MERSEGGREKGIKEGGWKVRRGSDRGWGGKKGRKGEDAKNEKRNKASSGPTLREIPLPKVIP